MTLLLTILQPATLVILQHTVLTAKVPLAKAAVPNDALGAFFAGAEGAFYLLGRHAAAYGKRHVQG